MKELIRAFFASPGPDNKRDAFLLYLKGLAMGAADIVPGVSGGTVALISGIYEDLLNAIRSFDAKALGNLAKFQLTEALAGVHLRFLVVLLMGILTAMVGLARIMHYMMDVHPIETWSLFFGMILASILYLAGKLDAWHGKNLAIMLLGAVFAYWLVGLIPVTTPETWWFIILCGMIAICAMILPGISGSFLLLILGKYQFITGAIKDPTNPQNLMILGLFLIGALFGITGFSRVLGWFLQRFHMATLAFLTGLMVGSLRKIWPWKEVLETRIIRGKTHVIREANLLPQVDWAFFQAIGLMALGFGLVWLLDHMTKEEAES